MICTRFVEHNNRRLAVYENELITDTYILFIHGNSESAQIFKEQFSSDLSHTFQLVAFDLPGHGNSLPATNPSETYRLPCLVELTGTIIEDMNKPVVIVGSSLGGHIALEASVKYPRLVKALFLDSTPPVSSAADFAGTSLPNPAASYLFKELISDDELRQLSISCLADARHFAFFEEVVKKSDPRFRSVLLQSVLNNEMQDEIAIAENGTIPVAIIHGEADKIINKHYYEGIAFANLWRGEIHLVPNAGHLPCLENPGVYNRLLKELLKEIWQNN
jgi:pimeloyl-ACP methyl ester carboxylesterase